MKQYCLKLDDWLADELENYLRIQNAKLPRWRWLNRNRLINIAISAYIRNTKE